MSQFTGPGQAHQGIQVSRYKGIKDDYFKKPKLSLSESFEFLQLYAKPSTSLFRTRRNENDLIAMAKKIDTINSETKKIPDEQQKCIAKAIVDGKFGDPMPKELAEKIIDNLGAFTNPDAQRDIAKAISDGKFKNLMRDAARNDNTEIMQVLLDYGADVDQAFQHGETPLFIAAKNGHTEIVKLLLENRAGVDQARTIDGATPMYIAAQNGHTEAIRVLAEFGANINARDMNGRCSTPMYIAAQNGHTEAIRVLADLGANINTPNKNGATPMYIAAQNRHDDAIRVLAEFGANINQPMNDGATPLLIAAQKGHKKTVELLLNSGAKSNLARSVKYKLENNRTITKKIAPIHIASRKGHTEIVKLLIEKGADINLLGGLYNQTPLHLAVEKSHKDIVELLIEKEANLTRKSSGGNTPLDIIKHKWQNKNNRQIKLLLKNAPKQYEENVKQRIQSPIRGVLDEGGNISCPISLELLSIDGQFGNQPAFSIGGQHLYTQSGIKRVLGKKLSALDPMTRNSFTKKDLKNMENMISDYFKERLLKVKEGIKQLTEVQKRDLNVNQKKTDISKYTIEEFKILEEKIQELLNFRNLEAENGV